MTIEHGQGDASCIDPAGCTRTSHTARNAQSGGGERRRNSYLHEIWRTLIGARSETEERLECKKAHEQDRHKVRQRPREPWEPRQLKQSSPVSLDDLMLHTFPLVPEMLYSPGSLLSNSEASDQLPRSR